MTQSDEQVSAALHAAFLPGETEWKVQTAGRSKNGIWAMIVPYIDTRAIVHRLMEAFGPAGFDLSAEPILGGSHKEGGRRAGFLATITARWPSGAVTVRQDVSEETGNDAMKGGISGAYKRAAVHLGIGRYLYDSPKFYAEVYEGVDGGEFQGSFKDRQTNEWVRFRWSIPREALDWMEVALGSSSASPAPSPSRTPSSNQTDSPRHSPPARSAAPGTPSSPSQPAKTTSGSGAKMPGRTGWFGSSAGEPIENVHEDHLRGADSYYAKKISEDPNGKWADKNRAEHQIIVDEMTRRGLTNDAPAANDGGWDQSSRPNFEDFPDELRAGDDDLPF